MCPYTQKLHKKLLLHQYICRPSSANIENTEGKALQSNLRSFLMPLVIVIVTMYSDLTLVHSKHKGIEAEGRRGCLMVNALPRITLNLKIGE